MSKTFDYLEQEPAPDAPVSDNPSGLYCPACRHAGMYHCAHPDECGNMRRMKPNLTTDQTKGGCHACD